MRIIAVEEHIFRDEFNRLDGRLQDMDQAGIDMQVLSLAVEPDKSLDSMEASAKSRTVNESLADIIEKYPDRFSAFASLALENPEASTKEFERTVTQFGFRGAIINVGQAGEYIDDHKYWPIFEAAEKMDVPVYLHPGPLLPDMRGPYMTYPILSHAMWGFGAGTGLQAMRLICSGIFDEYPKLKIILGHMGEGIPFWLWRIDNHWFLDRVEGVPGADWLINSRHKKTPGGYFRDNFYVTISGMFWQPALQLIYSALGPGRILFAVDYPHESCQKAVELIESAQMTKKEKEMIFHENAETVLNIHPWEH